jgi:hypothetical protein
MNAGVFMYKGEKRMKLNCLKLCLRDCSMLSNRSIAVLFILSVVFTGLNVAGAEVSTYAQRLGWPVGTKVVILHDYDAHRGMEELSLGPHCGQTNYTRP